MAGHSHAKNVMHQKGASDAKKAKIFNKLAREITVSAKIGSPDPAANPRLRAAIIDARKNNMPKERIERAIKVAQPGAAESALYEEVRYEGYGPGGSALIIEALTDNRNRTASELRTAFSKNGGSLGESGSVGFMFLHLGEIVFLSSVATADAMLEAGIVAGADNVESTDQSHIITCRIEDFGPVRNVLEAKFGEAESAKLVFKPTVHVAVQGEIAKSLLKLIEVLEDNDDVQTVYSNYDIDESELAQLTA